MPLPYLFLPLARDFTSAVATFFETLIQFCPAVYHGMNCYNAVVMLHPTSLDIWGKGDLRIITDNFESDEQKKAYEEATNAYDFCMQCNDISTISCGENLKYHDQCTGSSNE